jgi:aromatic ring-opening dioxygenase LigB subunit
MTSFEYIVRGVCAVVIIALGLWFFYRAACRTDRNLNDELPYKVDAPKTESKSQKRIIITPTDVRIAKKFGLTLEQYARELIKIKPKRKYTKRSKYWNTGRR